MIIKMRGERVDNIIIIYRTYDRKGFSIKFTG